MQIVLSSKDIVDFCPVKKDDSKHYGFIIGYSFVSIKRNISAFLIDYLCLNIRFSFEDRKFCWESNEMAEVQDEGRSSGNREKWSGLRDV